MDDIANLLSLPTFANLTEAQWAERDAAIAAREAERAAALELERTREMRRDLVERGCPVKDLERAVSGKLDETKSVAAARQAILDVHVLTVLSGPKGCGKTSAAAWWLLQRRSPSEYVRTGPPRFVDASALARWPRYENAAMVELERASALVIDDLGVEYDDKGGAFRSFLDGTINARYAACLPSLMTTNLAAAAFKDRYGERIADRIREAGRFVELAGESLRRRA